jgi:hypothetical protein
MIVFKKWMLYVVVVIAMIITAPDMEAHERKVQQIFKSSANTSEIIQVSLQENSSLTYHNIFVFTYTRHNRRVLTFGAAGMVFDVGS